MYVLHFKAGSDLIINLGAAALGPSRHILLLSEWLLFVHCQNGQERLSPADKLSPSGPVYTKLVIPGSQMVIGI